MPSAEPPFTMKGFRLSKVPCLAKRARPPLSASGGDVCGAPGYNAARAVLADIAAAQLKRA
jgi:hypothetical protein